MTPAELTEAREALHLSQVELSRVLGVHPNIVSRWSLGKAKIPPYLHLAIERLDEIASLRRILQDYPVG